MKIQYPKNPRFHSFYVANIPGDISRRELWKLCDKIGDLTDIYIAGRRDASESFFAFVKFSNVLDVGRIEERLNEICCRGRKIVANCARHPRHALQKQSYVHPQRPQPQTTRYEQSRPRDGRSFADVISGENTHDSPPPPPSLLHMSNILEMASWTGKSVLIGEAKFFDSLCSFPSLLALEGFDVSDTKYLGGMQILIKFRTDKAAEVFKSNRSIWLKWFLKVEHYSKKNSRFERIVWIKIVGLPLSASDDSNFAKFAEKYGKILVNTNPIWSCVDVSYGTVCILTEDRKSINGDIEVMLEGVIPRIGIQEIDKEWSPFSFSQDEEGHESEEDDEAISDTRHQDGMDLEDGEIVLGFHRYNHAHRTIITAAEASNNLF
ncbi:hypothetical protein LXL04_029068 [Taraxacum kok-saghyz]